MQLQVGGGGGDLSLKEYLLYTSAALALLSAHVAP